MLNNATKNNLNQTLKKKSPKHELHKRNGDKFYDLKRNYRRIAKKIPDLKVIVMEYQRNLPTPNITTNHVYNTYNYRRQFNFISFNVHVFSNESSIFYTYDETVARKGANDVCSMLEHFFFLNSGSESQKMKYFLQFVCRSEQELHDNKIVSLYSL